MHQHTHGVHVHTWEIHILNKKAGCFLRHSLSFELVAVFLPQPFQGLGLQVCATAGLGQALLPAVNRCRVRACQSGRVPKVIDVIFFFLYEQSADFVKTS